MATRRPMKHPRPMSAVLAAGLGIGLLGGTLATPGADRPGAEPGPRVVEPAHRRIGAGSCAARGCHGGVGAVDPAHGDVAFAGGEFTTWRTFDPHARAYSVLLGARSRRIADRLRGRLGGKSAHEASACLSCHSPAAAGDRAAPRAGVDCETCHGGASGWKDAHLSDGWRSLGPLLKSEDGLADLSGPIARARSCVGCHVGARPGDQDVDHDLIAAGHPRLRFEYASYLAAYPKHWREPAGRDGGEAKAWALGQVVVAEAATSLLQGRARAALGDGKAAWPEFSEYACFSCHRELPASVGGPPGAARADASRGPLPWATWPLAMLPAAAGDGPEVDPTPLRSAMARDEPDPAQVAALAGEFAGALRRRLEVLDAGPFDAGRADRLLADLAAGGGPDRAESWDAAAQRFLAMAALARARGGPRSPAIPPEIRSALEMAPKLLAFPPGFDGPRRDRPRSAGEETR